MTEKKITVLIIILDILSGLSGVTYYYLDQSKKEIASLRETNTQLNTNYVSLTQEFDVYKIESKKNITESYKTGDTAGFGQ